MIRLLVGLSVGILPSIQVDTNPTAGSGDNLGPESPEIVDVSPKGETRITWEYDAVNVRINTEHGFDNPEHLFVNTDLSRPEVDQSVTQDAVAQYRAGAITSSSQSFYVDIGGVPVQYTAILGGPWCSLRYLG